MTSAAGVDGSVFAERIRFGKVVTEDGGPIASKADHDFTNASPDWPASATGDADPAALGPVDRVDKLTLPAFEREGAVYGRWSGDRRFFLLSRVRRRAEAGEGAGGRRFLQSNSWAFAAEDWNRYGPEILVLFLQQSDAEPDIRDGAPLHAARFNVSLAGGIIDSVRRAPEARSGPSVAEVALDRGLHAETLKDAGGHLVLLAIELKSGLPGWRCPTFALMVGFDPAIIEAPTPTDRLLLWIGAKRPIP